MQLSRSVEPVAIEPPRDAAPYIAGSSRPLGAFVERHDPFRGDLLARVAIGSRDDVGAAVGAAVAAQADVAAMPVHERASVLRRAAAIVEGRSATYADAVARQTGKALKNTLREVRRAAWTLRASATAAESLRGEVPAPDVAPDGEGVLALTIREPVGVIGAITPFNAPFNLVVHKVGPAFAAGNAIVIKPASQAPLAAIDVAQVMEEAGAPAGAVNVVPGNRETVAALVEDARVSMYTLTGSRAAGEALVRGAGLRRVVLELGGNSPNIVHRDAPLGAAAAACLRGGFANTGQSCNSVQRILVHRQVIDEFSELLVAATARLKLGDPLDPDTDIGTLVDAAAAERIDMWINDATSHGARILIGGRRQGAQLEATVVADAPIDSRLVCDEIFGPVVVLLPYGEIDEAIDQANATPYGLQAAVFTESLDIALRVARGVRAGAVLVNKSTNFRMDHLPYGGVKESGIGREGPAYAVEEMTELKLVVIGRSDAIG